MQENLTFYLKEIELDLKVNWKISRNESTQKTNFIFMISEGDLEFYGEIAPNIRYQETIEKIEEKRLVSYIYIGPERLPGNKLGNDKVQIDDSIQEDIGAIPWSEHDLNRCWEVLRFQLDKTGNPI